MKTTLLAVAITFSVAIGFVNETFAQSPGNLFSISNQQSKSLGSVTISAPSGDEYLAVPGNSNDTVDIPDTATSIAIYGQVVPQGIQAFVTLPDGTIVAVMWVTPNSVIVVDRGELD
jgi:hypothetical protein